MFPVGIRLGDQAVDVRLEPDVLRCSQGCSGRGSSTRFLRPGTRCRVQPTIRQPSRVRLVGLLIELAFQSRREEDVAKQLFYNRPA